MVIPQHSDRSSMPFPFFIVDVFAETKYAGNQLAVVLEAGFLSTEQMQRIARETNFSETTFIQSAEARSGGYDVRIFTPVEELPFAGHPTLGTAFILQQMILQKPVETIILNLKVGQIPVTPIYQGETPELLWMTQNPPEFGEVYDPEAIAAILNLDSGEIDSRFPIQTVSTGVPCIIVPVRSRAALKHIRVNRDRYFEFIQNSQAKAIHVFCPEAENPNNQFSVRMFAEALGVTEDPATGSTNGCFAAYLVQHRYLGSDTIEVRVEQGAEIGRPSLLLLKAQANSGPNSDTIAVQVGGKVILVAKGEFV